jgi:hypothetical protein
MLDADMVDAKNWSHDQTVALMETFLREEGLA